MSWIFEFGNCLLFAICNLFVIVQLHLTKFYPVFGNICGTRLGSRQAKLELFNQKLF